MSWYFWQDKVFARATCFLKAFIFLFIQQICRRDFLRRACVPGTTARVLDPEKEILSLYFIGRSDVLYRWVGGWWVIEYAWGLCRDS